MFIKILSRTCAGIDNSVISPSLEDVRTAIKLLNGSDCSEVILATDVPVPHMGIGGGLQGWFIAYITYDNLSFLNLRDDMNRIGAIEMECGGQSSERQLKECVTLKTVLQATLTFATSGKADPDLQWLR